MNDAGRARGILGRAGCFRLAALVRPLTGGTLASSATRNAACGGTNSDELAALWGGQAVFCLRRWCGGSRSELLRVPLQEMPPAEERTRTSSRRSGAGRRSSACGAGAVATVGTLASSATRTPPADERTRTSSGRSGAGGRSSACGAGAVGHGRNSCEFRYKKRRLRRNELGRVRGDLGLAGGLWLAALVRWPRSELLRVPLQERRLRMNELGQARGALGRAGGLLLAALVRPLTVGTLASSATGTGVRGFPSWGSLSTIRGLEQADSRSWG
jgi:hypothetical protein